MKVWIIVSVMFLMENSQVKIAETVNDSSRFFNTEEATFEKTGQPLTRLTAFDKTN